MKFSTRKILCAFASATIILSLSGQLLTLLIPHLNKNQDQKLIDGISTLQPFIFPGLFLSLVMLILNIIRSVKNRNRILYAALYGIILTTPISIPITHSVILEHLPSSPLNQKEKLKESEEFIAGTLWAQKNNPLRNTQCTGSHEFKRGCWTEINKRRARQQSEGYEWARNNQPEKISLCAGPAYFVLGCSRFFIGNANIEESKNGKTYASTADCVEDVNANYKALMELDLEHENYRKIAINRVKNWEPALKNCLIHDKINKNRKNKSEIQK